MKPLDQFPPVRRGEPKLQSWCRDCFATYGAEYYRRNREREKARLLRQVAARRAEARGKIIEYLLGHPCVDCGETDITVLEFDHLADKVADVSAYSNGSRSWERIKAEIDKCEVRCANCHRRRTRATWSKKNRVPATTPRSERKTPRAWALQLTIEAVLGTRLCRVCGENKPLSEFPFRSVERQTRQRICLICQRLYTKEWYSRNRQRHIAQARLRRDATARAYRSRIRDYLLQHPCVDCGESDPDVLDFDHVRDKRANVSALVHGAVSWELVLAEIGKCEVRCANCHRRRTAQSGGYYRALATQAARIGLLTP